MSARGQRYEAIQSGSSTYWTGVPCARGHIDLRNTRTGHCVECRRENDRNSYKLNLDKIIERKKSYYSINAEQIKQKRRLKYAQNPDKERIVAKERSAQWRANNPDKVKAQRPLKNAYKKANPHKSASLLAKRRASKKQRTPRWLTADDLWIMDQAYELAALRSKMTGFAWHVDHIFPLQGDTVSGLHVPSNLRVIPWSENLSKANKFPADVVAALGNGSTKAGSDKLYEMMHSIRAHHRSAKPEDLPPPAKKSPLDYLKKRRS